VPGRKLQIKARTHSEPPQAQQAGEGFLEQGFVKATLARRS